MNMKFTVLRAALLVSSAILLSNQAFAAGMNNPPPAGPVVLDLAGQPVPHIFTSYSTGFTATTSSSDISFAFREGPLQAG